MDDEWDFEEDEAGNDGEPVEEYRVGYKKPPRETQWKKGQSGHPGGRPRGSKDLGKIIRQHANEMVTVRIDGKEKRVPMSGAIVKRMMRDAAAGRPAAVVQVIKLLQRYDLSDEREEDAGDLSVLTLFELAFYGRLAIMLRQGKKAYWAHRRDERRAAQKQYDGRPDCLRPRSFETEQGERAREVFIEQLAALKAEDEAERQAAIEAGELEYYLPQSLLLWLLAAERGGVSEGKDEPGD